VSRPALPATRDERIALARATIEELLGPDDQLEPEHQRAFDDAGIAVFQVQVPTFADGIALNEEIAEALITGAGFPAVTYGSPIGGHDRPECTCYYRVPVGAP
jgi:hypothetical protein